MKGLLAAAAALSVPTIVPSSDFGANAPNRITMGCIGLGGMGANDMRAFWAQDDAQALAASNVNRSSSEWGHWYKLG